MRIIEAVRESARTIRGQMQTGENNSLQQRVDATFDSIINTSNYLLSRHEKSGDNDKVIEKKDIVQKAILAKRISKVIVPIVNFFGG